LLRREGRSMIQSPSDDRTVNDAEPTGEAQARRAADAA
jgi:hypothetical protein